MPLHPLAGKPAPQSILTNIPRLVSNYYALAPDAGVDSQRVSFGTSGHRGSANRYSFNEAHILAISQAVCEFRASSGINGPLFLGMDTHALSELTAISTQVSVTGQFSSILMVGHVTSRTFGARSYD